MIGFRFHGGVLGALASVAIVAAFGFALSWIFAFVALTVRGAEAAQSAGFVVIFPLVFASSVFVPVSSMPDWLQAFAKVSPVTLTADAARSSRSTRRARLAAGRSRLDRRAARRVHPAVRLALPADELNQLESSRQRPVNQTKAAEYRRASSSTKRSVLGRSSRPNRRSRGARFVGQACWVLRRRRPCG